MSQEPRTPTSITDELSRMGKLVAQAVQAAWESEERKRLEAEIVEGLRKFGDEVSSAAKRAGDSEPAKEIKAQAEKVAAEVKEKDIAEEIRKGLITGLEAINVELGKLVERLEPKPVRTAPAAEAPAEAMPTAEPVAEAPAEPAPEADAAPTPEAPETA